MYTHAGIVFRKNLQESDTKALHDRTVSRRVAVHSLRFVVVTDATVLAVLSALGVATVCAERISIRAARVAHASLGTIAASVLASILTPATPASLLPLLAVAAVVVPLITLPSRALLDGFGGPLLHVVPLAVLLPLLQLACGVRCVLSEARQEASLGVQRLQGVTPVASG